MICINHRPEKTDPNCCRITVGGNFIKYPGVMGTKIAEMLTVKLLFNGVISTPEAKFMQLDISNFYLITPMDKYKYLQMNLLDFPESVITQYKLWGYGHEGWEGVNLTEASMNYYKL